VKLWEIIVAAVVLFLIWGKLSKKVVPKNCIPVGAPFVPLLQTCSSGDNFVGGKTTVAGVCEPETPVIKSGLTLLRCDARVAKPMYASCSVHPVASPHIFFPVDPAIAPVPIPKPVTPSVQPISRPVINQVYYSNSWGNGPGWCVAKLNQLANNPGCRNMGSGCGTF